MRDRSSATVCGPRTSSTAIDRCRGIVELELLVGHLAEAGDASTVRRVDDANQSLRLHRRDRRVDLELVERHDRLTRRRLVARLDQRVHRQRILIGNRAFLLHQTAEHSAFDHRKHALEPTRQRWMGPLYHAGVIRLRQVVLAARDLDSTVDRLCAELELRVCFKDPGVAEFGLHNALLSVGDQFIEVVSPIADNTAAGRLLDRREADVTAYMVMFEVDDLDTRLEALDEAGVRTVWSGDSRRSAGGICTPATSVARSSASTRPILPDRGCGAGRRGPRTPTTRSSPSIAGYTIAVDDPAAVTTLWSLFGLLHGVQFVDGTISTIDLVATDRAAVGHTLSLDQVTLRLAVARPRRSRNASRRRKCAQPSRSGTMWSLGGTGDRAQPAMIWCQARRRPGALTRSAPRSDWRRNPAGAMGVAAPLRVAARLPDMAKIERQTSKSTRWSIDDFGCGR